MVETKKLLFHNVISCNDIDCEELKDYINDNELARMYYEICCKKSKVIG